MKIDAQITHFGAALSDPSRSAMLCLMMDGRAYTNKELASVAGVTPATATTHLQHLEGAGLTCSLKSGRCVYHRIANEKVAHALEEIAALSPDPRLALLRKRKGPESDMLFARSCYDHLAGLLGVRIAERLQVLGAIRIENEQIECDRRHPVFAELGVDLTGGEKSKRPFARCCLDWTERRTHISGQLGAALLERALSQGWLERRPHSRALHLTTKGQASLNKHLQLDLAGLRNDLQ